MLLTTDGEVGAMERESMTPLPTAVVLGASHWHAPLYRDGLVRRFRVKAVQDADIDEARRYALPLGASATQSVDEAIDGADIDVVFVFSPHHEMLAVASQLINRRTPFVIEKPAGTSLDDLRQMEAAARAAKVPATVALVQRGAPVDAWLRRAGDIIYERAAFIAGPTSRYRRNGNPWMLDPELSGGGSLMNLAPHFVDMAIRHLGRPTDVVRRLSATLHNEAVDDHATLVLTTGEAREAIVEVGYAFPDSTLKRYCSFSAVGTRGFASIDTTGSASFTDTSGITTTATLEVDSDPLYEVLVDGVADTLVSGFAGLPTLEELMTTMDVIWGTDAGTGAEGRRG
ncbi:Gfo/Idh/MocA family protein [Microbacterium aurantiacum]|uniref:Gfo/Idh/MocA family protein n=1 Tax=Microbacterium aurantiacum TaxID=162393 RepID=UPI004035A734